MTADTPAVLYVSIDRSGLSPVPVASFHKHMGAEEWVPEGAVVRVKALEWGAWAHGNAIAECIFGVYCIWDGYWRPPGQQGGFPSADPKAAAQADYESRIRAALDLTTEPEPTSGWQPIETAPKDGTRILLCGPDKNGGVYMDACGWPKGWAARWPVAYMAYADGDPTHWMPLPPAPDDHDGGNPTSGAYDMICCTAEDVVQGRGFTGDAAADLATAQESLRVCLGLLGWRG